MPAWMEGIATQEPHKNKTGALENPSFLECLDGISGAGGRESASMRDKRRYRFLIKTYCPDKIPCHVLYRKLMSAFLASCFQDITAASGFHPTTETVLTLADDLGRCF